MDSPGYLALVRLFAPKVPRVMSDAAAYTLGISATSSKWDLRTTVIMSIIRQFLNSPNPSPVSKQQRLSLRDPGIKGPLWISKQTLDAPQEAECNELLSHVQSAIDALAADAVDRDGDGGDGALEYTLPSVGPVEVEWTGSRAGASSQAPRPDLDEDGQYERLMASVSSDVTILYFHGGALYLMDPATHRVTCARLAKHTRGRCVSVRYRLAPQHPFPAALVDCLVAYLSLLSPGPDAVHEPVPARKIVFAGDSAGGNLSLALLQLILQMGRAAATATGTTISGTSATTGSTTDGRTVAMVKFHGRDIAVEPPAGVAVMSPWTDITRSLPSIWNNQVWDYLPSPPPDVNKTFAHDELWPAKPPRGDLYCETGMLLHPLVSPLAARRWHGAPPVFICVGQESLTDEAAVMARRLAGCNVPVEFWEFEAMPHVFTAVLGDHEGASLGMERWGTAAARMVRNTNGATGTDIGGEATTVPSNRTDGANFNADTTAPRQATTIAGAAHHLDLMGCTGVWVAAKTLRQKELDVRNLIPQLTDEEVDRRMAAAQTQRAQGKGSDERLLARL